MSWLSFILRGLGPVVVEHGSQVLRNILKARAEQAQVLPPAGPNPVQQLAADLDQLKAYVLELKSEIDTFNREVAAREERLRKWLLALLAWNVGMTVGLVVIAVLALRR